MLGVRISSYEWGDDNKLFHHLLLIAGCLQQVFMKFVKEGPRVSTMLDDAHSMTWSLSSQSFVGNTSKCSVITEYVVCYDGLSIGWHLKITRRDASRGFGR